MRALPEPNHSIHQVYHGPSEDPALAQGSGIAHVAYDAVYWPPLGGNIVKPLLSGADYFKELIAAIDGASKEVLIAGWQVNWDAQIDARGTRLFDLIYRNVTKKPGLKVYIMPWDDSDLRRADTLGRSIYDNDALGSTQAHQTASVFIKLDHYLRSFGRPQQVFVQLSKTRSDWGALDAMYSHHQKQAVIDRSKAFVGGIDLAYGRFDDARFTLAMEGRKAQNRYNGCIAKVGGNDGAGIPVRAQDLLIDDSKQGDPKPPHDGAPPPVHQRYREIVMRRQRSRQAWDAILKHMEACQSAEENLCDRRQWRMPWQDLQQQVVGPAVLPLRTNFVRRWNIQAAEGERLEFNVEQAHVAAGAGGCTVQVLRSASNDLCEDECNAIQARDLQNATNDSRSSLSRLVGPALFRSGVTRRDGGPQDDIMRATRNLIAWSQHYIYIENQFFVSDFGVDTSLGITEAWKPEKLGQPGNDIVECLATRIDRAIRSTKREPFHVYIVLPVHSEGMLSTGTIAVQVHFTMQTLVFGSRSLVKRIMASLVRQGRDPSEWNQYLTLLNLRTWGVVNGSFVTEQVYVHTKLMIVDDRFVLHGSANINDRSLFGTRDSELAILVHDTQASVGEMDGSGAKLKLRHATELRTQVWRKLFALDCARGPGDHGPTPATVLEGCLAAPAKPDTWTKIQGVAATNHAIYAKVFNWIPRDREGLCPVAKSAMPFEKAFFDKACPASNAARLSGIKGFITALPLLWTMGESNRGFAPAPLVAKHGREPVKPVG